MNTTTKANRAQRNIGIDVGKTYLDIQILELDRYWRVFNISEDIRELVKGLKRFNITRIVVEATGGYERGLVEALVEAGLPVVVVQPMNIRQFAKAQGILAKTDKIDAQIIALFGAKMEPEVRPISNKKVRYIRDLLARKRQLMEMRTQELNREQKAEAALKGTHRRVLKVLEKDIEWVNTRLAKEVAEVGEWQHTYSLLLTVPGIGDGVAYTLLARIFHEQH